MRRSWWRQRQLGGALALVLVLAVVTSRWWLPLPATLLVVSDPPHPAEAALLLEGDGSDSMDVVEGWRQQGLVQRVVMVEAPIRTQGLVAYWSDFVRLGVARPSPTPADDLSVVRATSTAPADQARAALPALQALGIHQVEAPSLGLGSRVTLRDLRGVLQPAGIDVTMALMEPPEHDPAHWYADGHDRQAVVEYWLQYVVPALAAGSAESGQ